MGYTAHTLTDGSLVMKQILMITAILSILAVALFGCLYIFEVLSYESALSNLVKFVAAIVLLGGCSALVMALMRSKD